MSSSAASAATRGSGADTFRLTDISAADVFTDYNQAEFDVVDLTALFEVALGHTVGEYVSHVGSELRVDVDGNVGGANFVTVASLPSTPSAITILYDDAAQATAQAAVV